MRGIERRERSSHCRWIRHRTNVVVFVSFFVLRFADERTWSSVVDTEKFQGYLESSEREKDSPSIWQKRRGCCMMISVVTDALIGLLDRRFKNLESGSVGSIGWRVGG